MRKGYIILAHKYAGQVERLVERLDDKSSNFFIHIDLRSDMQSFTNLFVKTNVHMVERVATDWAGFGIVKATMNAMHTIKESNINFDIVSLLSGQDYPIKSNAEIDAFFRKKEHSVFLDFFPLPNYDRWLTGGLYRINKYFFGLDVMRKYAAKAANLTSTYIPHIARKLPLNLKPFCGSQWWSMDMYALNYILTFLDEHPEYTAYHKYTFAPDELFFHIILLNSDDSRLNKSIKNDNIRYMNWIKLDNPHPEILVKHDLQAILNSPALFARKFDATIDYDILDSIDSECLALVKQ